MEPHQVGAEQPPQQLIPLRQGAEQLLRGEWDVEKESDLRVRQAAPEQLGKQEQLVVVDPDQVARLVVLHHQIGKPLVDLGVRLPVLDV
jgi:hypothetical protein